ncbi:18413_t:CDS:2 [Acaulospora morrowiae]|uniref:18413_t:CDS:1 n=1 Tax=Acaulospora morrowiae TaxID=94023 RepID=A0A9N8WTC3_9GLOM|nr:18413_t:CDS:2 [Acaulospora morrowiae]
MTIHVVIHFKEPVNKTFTFTEPDSLELGRSSFVPDPSISKKQVLFEVKDGRVYATVLGSNSMIRGTEKVSKNNKVEIHDGENLTLIHDKYPFTVTITHTQDKESATHEFRSPMRVEKMHHIKSEQVIPRFKKEKEIVPLPSSHHESSETPSQLLRELFSQDTIRDDDDVYYKSYENENESGGTQTSDDGIEVSDGSNNAESEENFFTDESSYLGSYSESSENDNDELEQGQEKMKEKSKPTSKPLRRTSRASSSLGQFQFYDYHKSPSIKQIVIKPHSLVINWENSTKNNSKFNYIWLRDNCQCTECIHPDNKQKLFSSSEVPLDIKPIHVNVTSNEKDEETMEVVWNKSLSKLPTLQSNISSQPDSNEKIHKGIYPISFLKFYDSKFSTNQIRFNHMKPITWNRNSILKSNLWVDHYDYMNSDKGLLKALRQLWDYGLVVLKGVPVELNGDNSNESIENVVKRIGTIRSTFYGRVFDVISARGAKNIAYTNLSLGLHMDLLYYEAPPGLQFLHCLINSENGGESIFSDSLMAVENFKSAYPEDFDILTKTALTFNYLNDGHHMHYNRPVIVVDEHNDTITVNHAPMFQGPIESLLPSAQQTMSLTDNEDFDKDDERTFRFYQAYQRFCVFIEDPELKYELKLKPGELVIFVNRRVLHSRTAFDGERHLKGSYLELCEFKDKFRVLMKKYID